MIKIRGIILFIAILLWAGARSFSDNIGAVLVLKVDGIINPVVGDYVEMGMEEAKKDQAAAVLIQLNTPGGLLDATRTAISAMINSDIPVIVYVSPQGTRATSAGVFITMASDIAAMAPETHIGAAHPVTMNGRSPARESEDPMNKTSAGNKASSRSVMEEKMVSDAAAYIRTLATDHGRNAEWAEQAVRKSISLTADEAQKKNVIEIIANSTEDLIQQINGRIIKKNQKTITLNLKNAPLRNIPMTPFQRFLHLLGHPNVAYILMMIGFYGIIYEFAHPGIGLGGAVGGICLLLAFYSLQVLPINAAGVILILLGIVCLILELLTPSHGVVALGGLIALGLGSVMLIDVTRDLSIPRVSLSLIAPSLVLTGGFFLFILKKVFSARHAKPRTGLESLMGSTGEVRELIDPTGLIFLNGELWVAESPDILKPGEKAVVVGSPGTELEFAL